MNAIGHTIRGGETDKFSQKNVPFLLFPLKPFAYLCRNNQIPYICTMQTFRIVKPAPALSPYIRYYWILRDDAAMPVSERTLPVGCVQLVFHKGKRLMCLQDSQLQPQSFISGQTFGFSDVVSTGIIEMITVVFQPYAAKVFLQIPLHLFNGQNVSTDEVEDRELFDLSCRITDTPDNDRCIRLIEQFFFRRLASGSEYNLKRLSTVLDEINLHPQINTLQLSDVACLSTKLFSRVFTDYIGTTPKEFLRIVRMQRALYVLQQNPGLPFAQVAYECGFSDQSHMIKEFKLFSGYTPAEYLSVCAPVSDYFSTL